MINASRRTPEPKGPSVAFKRLMPFTLHRVQGSIATPSSYEQCKAARLPMEEQKTPMPANE